MTFRKFFLIAALGLGGALVAPPHCQSQTNYSGPSGWYTNDVTELTNTVWMLARLLPSVRAAVLENHTNAVETYSFPITAQQTGAGRMVGSGETTINFRYREGNVLTNVVPFSGTYRVSGQLTTIGLLTRGIFRCTANGTVTITNTIHRFSVLYLIHFILLNNLVSGSELSFVTLSGLGTKFSNEPLGPYPASFFFQSLGSWTLAMNLTTTGRSVTGSANATLLTGETFHFNVRGRFRSTDGRSTLVLSAADQATRGSVLRVTMMGDKVTVLRGSISGQTIKAFY